jgi:hypothetical protein
MKQTNQLLSGFTAFTFLLSTMAPAWAQTAPAATTDAAAARTPITTTAGQVITGIGAISNYLNTSMPSQFTQNPVQLSMDALQAQLNSEMDKCALDSKVDGTQSLVDKIKAITSKTKTKTGAATCTAEYKGDACAMDCDGPSFDSPDCNAPGSITSEQKTIQKYVDYLNRKTKCSNKDAEALAAQKKVIDCQMGVLSKIANMAAQQAGQVLDANTAQYGVMNNYVGEVDSQMKQVDALVGEKGSLSQMLTTMENEVGKMGEAGTAYNARSKKLTEDYKTHASSLDLNQALFLNDCMSNNNSPTTAKTRCWRPVESAPGANGAPPAPGKVSAAGCPEFRLQSCSPVQAALSATQMELLQVNGKTFQTRDRCDQVVSLGEQFNTVKDDIMNKIGSEITTDQQIASAFGSNLTAKGADILLKGGAKCSNEAKKWKTRAQNGKSTDQNGKKYHTDELALTEAKDKLSDDLTTGMFGMNRNYSNVMYALTDKHVNINRAACSKDDPSKMVKCFSDMQNNLKSLIEGSGENTTTAKVIKGGTMTPGFAVPCEGLRGCVDSFQTIQKSLASQRDAAVGQRRNFATKANAQVDTVMSNFGTLLASVQGKIMDQVRGMEGVFTAFGVKTPSLNMITGEPLKAGEGPEGEKGPYVRGDMNKALAGSVPGGLLDINNVGLNEAFVSVKESLGTKAGGLKDSIKDWREKLNSYKNSPKTCGAGDRVTWNGTSCNDCQMSQTACDSVQGSSVLGGSLNIGDIFAAAEMLQPAGKGNFSSAAETLQSAIKNTKVTGNSDCKTALKYCNQCFANAKSMSGGYNPITDSSGKATKGE